MRKDAMEHMQRRDGAVEERKVHEGCMETELEEQNGCMREEAEEIVA